MFLGAAPLQAPKDPQTPVVAVFKVKRLDAVAVPCGPVASVVRYRVAERLVCRGLGPEVCSRQAEWLAQVPDSEAGQAEWCHPAE